MTAFPPDRDAALARLDAFVPHAGEPYARLRNYDLPAHPHVSRLSPYLRHRLITEEEVLRAVLAAHNPRAADKFIQEVVWRTYWKGWLEQRPGVWDQYRAERTTDWNTLQTNGGLRRRWEDACTGQTGIDCFDHWAHELAETGYLHNHARMWFASIWIFTLGLPWALGADFFLRHLLDGDPASNTLSWRWVAGLQTQGKTYQALADNIATYTRGRFRPDGLAQAAPALPARPLPPTRALPQSGSADPRLRTGLLLTEDDLWPDWLDPAIAPVAVAGVVATAARSHLHVAPQVQAFTTALCENAMQRLALPAPQCCHDVAAIVAWARAEDLKQIVMAHVPVGPAADVLSPLRATLDAQGIALVTHVRAYDSFAWPHANKGFFKFRDVIPDLIATVAA